MTLCIAAICSENICKNGAQEIPENNRLRFFHEIESLSFECELLLFGFAQKRAFLFHVDNSGEVRGEEHFAAIGSGATLAEGNLYFRQHESRIPIEDTFYDVYESARLAYEAKAPGVGETYDFYLLVPGDRGKLWL